MAPIESFFIKGLQSYPDDGLGRRASASVFFVCLVECFRQREKMTKFGGRSAHENIMPMDWQCRIS